jgi:hypothetical protein
MQVLRIILLVGLGMIPWATSTRAEVAEKLWSKQLNSSIKRIELEASRGAVELVPIGEGESPRVTVMMRLNAPTPKDAERAFERVRLRDELKADVQHLRVRDDRTVVFDWDKTLQMQIEVKLFVPPGLEVRLATAEGGVVAGDYRGNLEVSVAQGAVFIGALTGDFRARSESGTITAKSVSGTCDIVTLGGSILIGSTGGVAAIRNVSGSIEVQDVQGPLTVRGETSNVIVGLNKLTSGQVDIETSNGEIRANIDQGAPFSVDASTWLLGQVKVRGLEPVILDGAVGQPSMVGNLRSLDELIGEEMPALRLRSRGGDVELVGRTPLL